MPINLQALQTLLKMQSPGNMTSTGDPYVDQRRAQIVSGEDQYAPSELEQLQGQSEMAGQGLGVSRDMVRQHGILKGKQAAEAESTQFQHAASLERLKGLLGLQTAEAQAKAAEARAQANQASIDARTDRQINATDARSAASIGAMQTRLDDAQAAAAAAAAAKPVAIPADLLKRRDEAQSGYNSILNSPLAQKVLGSGRTQAYEQALAQILERKGSFSVIAPEVEKARIAGLSADQVLAEASGAGETLDPDEVAYIRLKLGQ